MEIVGYIGALIVGITLGLIGAGGSILTVPIFVYLFGIEAAVTAPAYSLFVVCVSSSIGTFIKSRQKEVNFKTAFFFGVPTIIAIYLTRKFLVPILPNIFLSIGDFELTKRFVIMGLFSVVMIGAALIMIKGSKKINEIKLLKKNHFLNFLGGLGIGSLSGIVGAGGGFMIIPALLKLGNLTMKTAIGTSLAIIAINTFFGFIGSIGSITIQWQILLTFTAIAAVGILVGNLLGKKINGSKLKKGFGYFVLILGLLILLKETIIN